MVLTREEKQRPSSLSLPLPMGEPSLLQSQWVGRAESRHPLDSPGCASPEPLLPTPFSSPPPTPRPLSTTGLQERAGKWKRAGERDGVGRDVETETQAGCTGRQPVPQVTRPCPRGPSSRPWASRGTRDTATGPWSLALHVTLRRAWGIPATVGLGSHFKSKRGTLAGSQSILSRAEQALGHPLP